MQGEVKRGQFEHRQRLRGELELKAVFKMSDMLSGEMRAWWTSTQSTMRIVGWCSGACNDVYSSGPDKWLTPRAKILSTKQPVHAEPVTPWIRNNRMQHQHILPANMLLVLRAVH